MRYLIMFQLKPGSDKARLLRDIPIIVDEVKHFAKGGHEIAYRSSDGLTFGIAFQTDDDVKRLARTITGSQYFLTGDGMVLTELGDLISGQGSSRFWTWLQHHK